MTNAESPSSSPSGTATTRLLRRRSSDRVIGGVAGGLGDYLNIDPLLVRIGLVGLMVFGGAGFVLYVVAWLLIPVEGSDRSALDGFLRRPHPVGRLVAWILLALAVWFVLRGMLTYGGYLSFGDPYYGGPGWGLVIAIAVIVLGVWLFRGRGTGTDLPRSAMVSPAQASTEAAAAAPGVVAARWTAPSRRPRSPLAWYVVAALLMGIGLLAMVSQSANLEVLPGQYFGAALAIVGIGLVIGAWWGHARILILLALLLVPMGVTASFITAPLEGGMGDLRYAPANAAELRDEYRLMGGRMVLDFSQLSVGTREVHISASVAVGQLVVILPGNASVRAHAEVGAGVASLFGPKDGGTSLDTSFVRTHARGTTFILELEAGIGEVEVYSDTSGGF